MKKKKKDLRSRSCDSLSLPSPKTPFFAPSFATLGLPFCAAPEPPTAVLHSGPHPITLSRFGRRLVAVKRLSPNSSGFREVTMHFRLMGFRRRLKAVGGGEHKALLKCYGVSLDGGQALVLLRRMRGSLLDVLPPAAALPGMAAALERGLNALHAEGVLHGDVGPGNVLLGQGRRGAHYAALGDFGCASTDPRDVGKGNRRWLAPEVVAKRPLGGDGAVEAEEWRRSDRWGLAMALLVAAGEAPLGDCGVADVDRMARSGELEARVYMAVEEARIGEDLKILIWRLLRKTE